MTDSPPPAPPNQPPAGGAPPQQSPPNQWSFATAVYKSLGQFGPVVIAVAGIIYVFTYLDDRNEDVRQRVAENTVRVLKISSSLIDNTEKLMALNKQVNEDANLQNARMNLQNRRLRDIQDNIRAKEGELAKKESLLESVGADLKKREEELSAANDDIARRKQAEEKKKRDTLKALSERAERIRALEMQVADLAKQLASSTPTGIAAAIGLTTKDILVAFAGSPSKETRNQLEHLVGRPESELRSTIIQGAGFATWFSLGSIKEKKTVAYLGIVRRRPDAYSNPLLVDVEKGQIVELEGDVVSVMAVRVPDERSWDRFRTALLIVNVDEERIEDDYLNIDSRLVGIAELVGAEEDDDLVVKTIFGTDPKIRVLSFAQLKQDFPKLYETWGKQSDYRGRPAINIAMTERAKGFKAENLTSRTDIFWAKGLKGDFAALVTAAVNRDSRAARTFLDVRVRPTELGRIGAAVLSEEFRINYTTMTSEFPRVGPVAQATPAQMTVQATAQQAPVGPLQGHSVVPVREKAVVYASYRRAKGKSFAPYSATFHFLREGGSNTWRLTKFRPRLVSTKK